MATVNYAFKEISCKIVYYGPGLCGKTTNLIKIHEGLPNKNRGELVSVATEQDRTLFFDFLPVDLGEVKGFHTKFQIYTVPGQVFYNATRKVVLRGADGIVFVVDSASDKIEENRYSWDNMIENLQEHGIDPNDIPIVIQYNKRDLPNALPLEELEATLNPNGVPSLEAIALDGTNVKETLKRVAGLVLGKIRNSAERGPASGGGASSEPSKLQQQMAARAAKPAATAHARQAAPAVAARGPQSASASGGSQPIPIKQRCDVYWRNKRIGGGFLEFAPAGDPTRPQPTFNLTAKIKVWWIIGVNIQTTMRFFNRENRKTSEGAASMSSFCEAQPVGKGYQSFVWVKEGKFPKIYLRIRGRLEYLVTPEGTGPKF